jgi:membrane associated rhomboid family serine protease
MPASVMQYHAKRSRRNKICKAAALLQKAMKTTTASLVDSSLDEKIKSSAFLAAYAALTDVRQLARLALPLFAILIVSILQILLFYQGQEVATTHLVLYVCPDNGRPVHHCWSPPEMSLHRHLTYMLAHEDDSHLWSNIIGQLVLAVVLCLQMADELGRLTWGDAFRRAAKVLSTYAVSGYCAALIFDWSHRQGPRAKSLIGASAGVFGLCGLVCIETVQDFLRLLWMAQYEQFDRCAGFMTITRSLIVGCIVAADLYQAVQWTLLPRSRAETLQVHFHGLVVGLSLGILSKLISHVYSSYCISCFCRRSHGRLNDSSSTLMARSGRRAAVQQTIVWVVEDKK